MHREARDVVTGTCGDARRWGLGLASCDRALACAGVFGLCLFFLSFSDPQIHAISKGGVRAFAPGIKTI